MEWSLSVASILELLGTERTRGTFRGKISGIADLRRAKAGQLSFLGEAKYAAYLGETEASVVLVPADKEGEPRAGQLWILVENPSLALAKICGVLHERLVPHPEAGVDATARVAETAVLGKGVSVGPNVQIAGEVELGDGVVVEGNVVIERGAVVGAGTRLRAGVHVGWGCQIGRDCLLHPGVIIGSDGFGYYSDANGHRKLPQIGIVVVEDDVEIGANACIDRARFEETRIGAGSRLDNLVHVGHNVQIGHHCILCAQVGIAGSAELGNFVVFGGQVGVNGHIKIEDGVQATGQTGISKNTPAGMILSGSPARNHRDEMKRQALLKQLPQWKERLGRLEERMESGGSPKEEKA